MEIFELFKFHCIALWNFVKKYQNFAEVFSWKLETSQKQFNFRSIWNDLVDKLFAEVEADGSGVLVLVSTLNSDISASISLVETKL